MSIVVRKAKLSDSYALSNLFGDYRQFYEKAPDPVMTEKFVIDRLNHGDSEFFLELFEGRPCGFLQIYSSFTSLDLGKIWIINDLYVDTSFREKGVASQLMAYAQQEAEKNHILKLVLETQPDNKVAQKLYTNLGYQTEDSFLTYYKKVS